MIPSNVPQPSAGFHPSSLARLSQASNLAHPSLVGIQHRTNIVPLTEPQVRFEIDMCIGCDRCMRACPVPLSASVNIADLNLATISDEIAPHVARFTDECVMCGLLRPRLPRQQPSRPAHALAQRAPRHSLGRQRGYEPCAGTPAAGLDS